MFRRMRLAINTLKHAKNNEAYAKHDDDSDVHGKDKECEQKQTMNVKHEDDSDLPGKASQ